MRDTIIILMKYDEPEWRDTFDCVHKTGCPIIIADRAGVGSMAAAYNKALVWNLSTILQYKYVWFVSNVTFPEGLLSELTSFMELDPQHSVIHPAFGSDHNHLCPPAGPDPFSRYIEVPFIEFTAPLMRTDLFGDGQLFLDEDMPFTGHDLDWSYRAKELGKKLFVDRGVTLGHTYIRRNKNGHLVTDIRKKIRKSWEPHTVAALERKYGTDWRTVLGYKGAV